MTTTKSRKAKGREHEKAVAAFFTEHGVEAERDARRQGSADEGDIAGLPHLAVQCKATVTWGDINGALADADKQAVSKGTATHQYTIPVVFKKQVGKQGVQHNHVIMRPEHFMTLYRYALQGMGVEL